jgi:hypothetical protein
MADAFANLSKPERIEKAVKAYLKDHRLKSFENLQICYTTIIRRLKDFSKPEKVIKQHL